MRFLLVVNPTSGGGRRQVLIQKALKYFRKKGDEVVVHWTQCPGDATAVVQNQGTQGFDAVVAAGGDGTLHEVIQGLQGTGVPLGILPWGTGNVFAKEMGLPRRVKAQCRVIRKGRALDVDLGLADGHPFLLMASFGIDAYALASAGSWIKKLWGLAAYAWAGLRAVVRYRHRLLEVQLDDGRVDRGSYVLVSNTRLYGAFFVLHPRINPTDGQLDVFVFRDLGRWSFLGMVTQLLWHTLVRSRAIPRFLGRHGMHQTRSLRVIPGRDRPMQLDGDPFPGAEEFSIVPRSLRVLIPRRSMRRYQ